VTIAFSRLAGNAEAYGLLSHRHTPEIQQETRRRVALHATSGRDESGDAGDGLRSRDDPSLTTESALNLLRSTYAEDPFVVVVDEPPTLRTPLGAISVS